RTRDPLRTLSSAAAASTDLSRQAFPRRLAAYRPAWRRLAPGRCRCRLAAAAAGDARASGHAEAVDRGPGARFLAPDDPLQGAALSQRPSIAGWIAPVLLRRGGTDRRSPVAAGRTEPSSRAMPGIADCAQRLAGLILLAMLMRTGRPSFGPLHGRWRMSLKRQDAHRPPSR